MKAKLVIYFEISKNILDNWRKVCNFAENLQAMRLSVITINYNDAKGLEHTVKSVIGQSSCDFEFIVIDGGSTDGSVDVIRKYADRIDYWVSEPDGGIYPAMNKGVRSAKGDYCIFMNSGDCFYDDMVVDQFNQSDHKADIIVGKTFENGSGKELFKHPEIPISLYYLYSGTIAHQGSFIKTDLLRRHPYDESLRIVADWKFYVEALILDCCTICFSDLPVTLFDTNGVSTTNPEKMWKEKEGVLRTLFPERVLKDYERMKLSECLTQTLTPQLRNSYRIDKVLYNVGRLLLKLKK